MKRVWLTLCAVMVFVSACATETFPILIPSAEEPTEQNPAALEERAALVVLYQATNGANWAHSDNWLSDAPVASWYGVVTDDGGGVTELNLPANGLSGPIPDLSALTSLTRLSLQTNQLRGPVPDLSALTSLIWLDLGHNQLRGPVPDLSALTSLSRLFLGVNGLSGPVPDLSALTNLTRLDLESNQLSGPIPDLSTLTNLTRLDLESNQLSGPVPDLRRTLQPDGAGSRRQPTERASSGYERTGQPDKSVPQRQSVVPV